MRKNPDNVKINYNMNSKRTVFKLNEIDAEVSVSDKLKQILTLQSSHLTVDQLELA